MATLVDHPIDAYVALSQEAQLNNLSTDVSILKNPQVAQQSHQQVTSALDGKELCVRSEENSLLLQAYKRSSQNSSLDKKENFVLVSGEAGGGKTDVANSLKDMVEMDGGYFVTGRFDVMSMEPYDAFVVAFTDFTNQVIEEGQVTEIKAAIHRTVKSETAMLTNMIPALEQIIGSQSEDETALPSQDSASRFAFVFRLFLIAIATSERPLVIFLDNLHNADQASLDLLSSLVSEIETKSVLFLCTCSNKLIPTDAVCEMLRKIEKNKVKITNIAVSNLGIDAISDMVAKLLNIPRERSEPLAALILIKSSGNLFFVLEYIRRLLTDKLLLFDSEAAQWVWDQDEVRRTLDLTSVRTLLCSKMQEVPQQLQELLKVASCIGSNLDENILSRAMSAPVSAYLALGRKQKLLTVDRTAANYTFASGHVQDAFYGLIKEEKRPEFHLAIGRRLLKNFSNGELHRHIFVVVSQFRHGESLVASQQEKDTMASLCLLAGKKAAKASSFGLATEYFRSALSLLSATCWQDQYDLSLDLHSSNAEVLYVLPDFGAMGEMLQAVFVNARDFNGQLRAWYVRVISLGAQDRVMDAINDGLFVLSELGETFPKKPSLKLGLFREYRSIRRQLDGMTDEMILRLPRMTSKISAMQMLNLIFFHAYLARNKYYPFVVLRMVRMSLKHGLCEISAFGFAMFGTMVCGVSGDIQLGCRYGDLSLRILKKFHAREWVPRVYFVAHGLLGPWKKPLRHCLPPLLDAYKMGLESGDIEYALLASMMYCFNSIDISESILDVERDVVAFTKVMELHKHQLALMLMRQFALMLRSMIGSVSYKQILHNNSMDGDNGDSFLVAVASFLKAVSAFLFGDLEIAEKLTITCYNKFKSIPLASFEMCQIESFISIVSISAVKAHQCKAASRRIHMKLVRRTEKRLRKWVELTPNNCYGKLLFLQAEMAGLNGDFARAHGKYVLALASTKTEKIVTEHALIAERAGLYMFQEGELALSKQFYLQSHETYLNWGALARASYIKEKILDQFPSENWQWQDIS